MSAGRRGLGVVAAAGLLLLLAACGSQQATKPAKTTQPETGAALPAKVAPTPPPQPAPPPLPDDGRTRVALLAPVSGPNAALGQALVKAAQMALFDVGGENFLLLVKDTGGTPAGAQVAAREALDEGARLLLGPLLAASVSAVGPEAVRRGVPVLALSSDRSVAGDGVYLLGVAPGAQVSRVIEHAARAEGVRRFGVIAPNSPYGNAVIEAMQAGVARLGAELTKVVTYPAGSPDLSQEVQRLADYQGRRGALLDRRRSLAAAGGAASRQALSRLQGLDTLGPPAFEALMIPAGGSELLQLASLLPYYDVDPSEVRFLGTLLWDDPGLGTEPALVGGRFAAPPPEPWALFSERYQATYGEAPPRLASLAYDGTALAAVLLREAEASGQPNPYTAAALTKPSGFAGVDGIFRLRPSGEIERGLAVLELQREDIVVVEPAPASFAPLAF